MRSSSSFLAFSLSSQRSIASCSCCFRSCSFFLRSWRLVVISSLAFFILSRLAWAMSSSAWSFLLFSMTLAVMSSRSCCFRSSSCCLSARISSIWPSSVALNLACETPLPAFRKASSSCRCFSPSNDTTMSQWSIGFSFGLSGTAYLGRTCTQLRSLVSSLTSVIEQPYGGSGSLASEAERLRCCARIGDRWNAPEPGLSRATGCLVEEWLDAGGAGDPNDRGGGGAEGVAPIVAMAARSGADLAWARLVPPTPRRWRFAVKMLCSIASKSSRSSRSRRAKRPSTSASTTSRKEAPNRRTSVSFSAASASLRPLGAMTCKVSSHCTAAQDCSPRVQNGTAGHVAPRRSRSRRRGGWVNTAPAACLSQNG
mmetsp:Transcript_12735/g.39890  ORF Transcript_12735/g.39890 Transcript_12735/m.39890 type:complete len:369 (+) Transcript_12735:873-1979(+)